jgi:CTP:molybdopterin cytidylyltransferase MocA
VVPPAWRCALSIAAVVLAAGSGRRIGGPKALLRYHGALLVEHTVRMLGEAGCDPVVVVLGAGAEQITSEADLSGATVVVNKAWGTGLGSSLRTGLQAVEQAAPEAAVLMPVDMPGVTAEAVRRVGELPHPDALACATYEGRRSYPMLIGRSHFAGVATLATADVGVRPYLVARAGQVTEIACDGVATPDDVDTPADAERVGIDVPAGGPAVT